MKTSLSRLERFVAWSIDRMNGVVFGYVPEGINQEFVATFGLRRYFRFMREAATVMGRLTRRYGEANAQFIIGLAGMVCGCGFCGYGHVFTANLLVFRDEGVLHPLHPRVVDELLDMTDQEALARAEHVLRANEHERLRTLVTRLLALKVGLRQPVDDDDRLLQAALSVWAWTVECTIIVGMPLRLADAVPHGHSVCRNRALKERYERARAAEARGS